MKRTGFLIEQVADIDNLRFAFYKAQRGKGETDEIFRYREKLDENLLKLREELLAGSVKVGDYHLFKIFDPKERVICAAAFRERVLHHALMNICAPYFEKHFIATTYANRKGKGVYKALEEAFSAINRYKYVAKLDVRKYFDNIGHTILMEQLCRLFKDSKLLQVLRDIVDSYHVQRGKGLPIGNLTSQYFANYYLSGIDHYAKERMHIPVYVRYMDDIMAFGEDGEVLKAQIKAIQDEADARLQLTMKPPLIQTTEKPTAFLGYRLSKYKVGLTQRSKRRFARKYVSATKAMEYAEWSEREVQAHILPLFAFARHAYTKQYRKEIIDRVASRRVLTA